MRGATSPRVPGVTLGCGETPRPARLAYGTLNAARDNAIVYPTWYSGRHWDNEWLIGQDMGLDPNRWFIIVPNMFGNGLSSSPSNTPPPWDRARFPQIAVRDNVAAQHWRVTEFFGIETRPLVLGWSMGAGRTYQWAGSYPDIVQRILPFCGSARTAPHNRVFLDSLRHALRTDAAFAEGWYRLDDRRSGACARSRGSTPAGASPRPSTGMSSGASSGTRRWRTSSVGFWEDFFLDDRDPNISLRLRPGSSYCCREQRPSTAASRLVGATTGRTGSGGHGVG
jgi:homoserine O-acetyltransferase